MHFPFFVLPFDHRNGLAKEILGTSYPFSPEDLTRAQALKRIIFDAFLKAKAEYQGSASLGILVDEETGMDIIMEAKEKGIPVTVSVEKSGTNELTFIHGEHFGERLNEIRPTFAKVLIHYHPGNEEVNAKQRILLKQLADFSDPNGVPLMLEVLLDNKQTNTPEEVIQVFEEIHQAGIKVALWKVEGLDSAEDWKQLAPKAQAPMIILGRGQDTPAIEKWVAAAAESKVVDGFAIGRTIFQEPLKAFVAGQLSKTEATEKIAQNYLHFIHLWEQYV